MERKLLRLIVPVALSVILPVALFVMIASVMCGVVYGALPEPYREFRVAGFQLDEDWVNNGTDSDFGTVENDTSNFKIGNQGLRLVTNSNTEGIIYNQIEPDGNEFSMPVKDSVGVWLRMVDVSTVDNVRIMLSDALEEAHTIVDSAGSDDGTLIFPSPANETDSESLSTASKHANLGTAIFFDTKQYVYLGIDTYANAGQDERGVSVWFKTSMSTGGYNRVIFDIEGYYSVVLDDPDEYIKCYFNGSTAQGIMNATPMNDDAWHHIVYTNDSIPSGGKTGTSHLYIDGAEYTSGKEENIANLAGASRPSSIGVGFDLALATRFNGPIDNVMYFSSYLDADDVAALWNGGDGTQILSGDLGDETLISHWKMDDAEIDRKYEFEIKPDEYRVFENNVWKKFWIPSAFFTAIGGNSTWGEIDGETEIDVKRVEIGVTRVADGSNADITLGEITTSDFPKAAIILTFDDAKLGAYTYGLPALRQRGWPGVMAIVPDVILNGGPPFDFVNISQIQEMYDAGWDITVHCWDHHTYNSDESDVSDDLRADLAKTIRWLHAYGWYRGSNVLMWPGLNATNENFDATTIAEEFFDMVRGVGNRTGATAVIGLSDETSGVDPIDWHQLASIGVDSTVEEAGKFAGSTFTTKYQQFFDDAIARKAVLSIYMHDIREEIIGGDMTPEFWDEMLAYLDIKVAAGELEVITFTEWYQLVNDRTLPDRLIEAIGGRRKRIERR